MRPLSRKKQILTEELPGETVIYDLERHRAHCLNEIASAIWKVCEGATTTGLIVERMRTELGRAADERLVQAALSQFQTARLINADGFQDKPLRGRVACQASPDGVPRVTSIVVPIRARALSRSGKHLR